MPQSSFRIAANASREPSGDQLGHQSLPPSPLETWRTSLPSGRIVKIAGRETEAFSVFRTNAIVVPSGDHTGMNSSAGSVSETDDVRAVRIHHVDVGRAVELVGEPGLQRPIDGSYAVLEKRICVPSGDHDGHESFTPSVRRTAPLPSGFAVPIPVRPTT